MALLREQADLQVAIERAARELGDLDPAEHGDSAPFQLRALEPRRTLVEKLFCLHHLASVYGGEDRREEERFGRHFYDIYKLLEHKATLQKLKEDRDSFAALVAEVERLSARHFGGTTPRPEEGFAASPGFRHSRESELRVWPPAPENDSKDRHVCNGSCGLVS